MVPRRVSDMSRICSLSMKLQNNNKMYNIADFKNNNFPNLNIALKWLSKHADGNCTISLLDIKGKLCYFDYIYEWNAFKGLPYIVEVTRGGFKIIPR